MTSKPSSRLRPIVAVIAVLAVGVTGAIVGTAFAAPGIMISEASTETVPVLAPVGFGPNAPASDPDDDLDTLDVSPAIAEQEVPVGVQNGLDPRLRALLDDLTTAEDPGSVVDPAEALRVLDDGTDGDHTEPGGDPCAPVDGEPAADCPEGLSGTVLALRASPHPDVVGTASPPTYEDSLYKLYYCDPQEHGDTELPFVAASNVPARITVTYWPISEPDAITSLSLETPPAARAEWERHFEAGEPFGEWTRIQHCTVLEGIEPGVGYRFRLDSVDILGGEATFTSTFSLPESRTRPPTRVLPIGDNIVILSMPHAASESVQFNAYVAADGAAADCTAPHNQLEAITPIHTAGVSAAHLERYGYQARFTKRTSQAFWAPEGSTIVVCLSSYLDSRASYNWAQANYRHQETLHSPDRMVPTVSLHSLELVRTVAADAVRFSATTRDNLGCGSGWRGPSAAGDDVPASDLRDAVLCSIGNHSGLVGLTTSSGDVVIHSAIEQGDNVTSTRNLLPLSRQACRGVCETPATSWYRISLATISVPDGICGSSFGDCDPPTRETSAGTALLKVEWEQGDRNGLADWGRTAPVSGQPAALELPAFPQMDTQQQITVTKVPGFYGADASFLLATDRPVTYTARMSSRCALPGGVTELTGHSEGRVLLHFSKLCVGESHVGQVELTDDAGAVSTYNVVPGDNLWAYGAAGVGLPGEASMLSWSFSLSRTELSPYHLSDLQSLSIVVDGTVLSDRVALGCQPDADVTRTSLLTPDAHLSELVTVQVSTRLAPAASRSDGLRTCQPAAEPGRLSFTAEVPRSDLFGDGVTISAPDGGEYRFTLTLRAS